MTRQIFDKINIDFISDVHTDFWITEKQDSEKLRRQVKRFVHEVLKPKSGRALIIAGDLGHYITQDIEVLKELRKYYLRVVIVRGNHDMYLVSGKQQSKYEYSSTNRVNAMKVACLENGIDYLDGGVIEVDGIRIGGVGMWYDLPDRRLIERWQEVMNDSNLIMEREPFRIPVPYGSPVTRTGWDPQEYYMNELEKLKNLGQCDILVTHVSPVIIPDEHQAPEHRGNPDNVFYESDNLKLVQKINPAVVIFGHTHRTMDFSLGDQWFVCNPLGYKGQRPGAEIQQLTISLEKK